MEKNLEMKLSDFCRFGEKFVDSVNSLSVQDRKSFRRIVDIWRVKLTTMQEQKQECALCNKYLPKLEELSSKI